MCVCVNLSLSQRSGQPARPSWSGHLRVRKQLRPDVNPAGVSEHQDVQVDQLQASRSADSDWRFNIEHNTSTLMISRRRSAAEVNRKKKKKTLPQLLRPRLHTEETFFKQTFTLEESFYLHDFLSDVPWE